MKNMINKIRKLPIEKRIFILSGLIVLIMIVTLLGFVYFIHGSDIVVSENSFNETNQEINIDSKASSTDNDIIEDTTNEEDVMDTEQIEFTTSDAGNGNTSYSSDYLNVTIPNNWNLRATRYVEPYINNYLGIKNIRITNEKQGEFILEYLPAFGLETIIPFTLSDELPDLAQYLSGNTLQQNLDTYNNIGDGEFFCYIEGNAVYCKIENMESLEHDGRIFVLLGNSRVLILGKTDGNMAMPYGSIFTLENSNFGGVFEGTWDMPTLEKFTIALDSINIQ